MRKDRVWMKFKKDDFNQLMGVLSKQIERYEEIEAQWYYVKKKDS